jgi:hypothetical protein
MNTQELFLVSQFLQDLAYKSEIEDRLANNYNGIDNIPMVSQFLKDLADKDIKDEKIEKNKEFEEIIEKPETVEKVIKVSRQDVKDGKIRWDDQHKCYVAVNPQQERLVDLQTETTNGEVFNSVLTIDTNEINNEITDKIQTNENPTLEAYSVLEKRDVNGNKSTIEYAKDLNWDQYQNQEEVEQEIKEEVDKLEYEEE